MMKLIAYCIPIFALIIANPLFSQEHEIYLDPSYSVDERVEDLLDRMTSVEKVMILSARGYEIPGVERLGIPSIKMVNGPAGIRWGSATAFPVPIAQAASWDTSMVKQIGAIIAEEAVAKGRNMLLAPNVNIYRIPFAGRNFENYGEDPYLASRMTVSFITGVQSRGVISCVTDFALNNQEWGRDKIDVQVKERALREIYLPPFHAALIEAKAGALITSSHMINGISCNDAESLLSYVLKEDWEYNGIVISGQDMSSEMNIDDSLLMAIDSGWVEMEVIDEEVRRMLRVQLEKGTYKGNTDQLLMADPNHPELTLQAAREGIVLLKNHGGILPIDIDSINSIALIGPNLFYPRTGGGGSSQVNPPYAVSPYHGIKNILGDSVLIYTAQGVNIYNDVAPLNSSHVYIGQGVHGFSAKYYNNLKSSGTPVIFSADKQIDFNWGNFSPHPDLKSEFSVRWEATLIPTHGGPVKVKMIHNDGCRIILDGKTIIDAWESGPVRIDSAWLNIEKGQSYNLQIDYFSDGGYALAKFGFDYVMENMIAYAVERARRADVAIVFAGLSNRFESEGFDREYLGLPNQSRLIREVYEANPNTIVVLQTGSAVDIEDWAFDIPAILQAWYPGQEGGTAIAEVLFGHFNPSGKLPFTWAMDESHYPGLKGYKSPSMRAWYLEDIFLGYRYMDKHKLKARFPFGHGMSYTIFGIGKLMMKRNRDGSGWTATFEIRNLGSRAGTEVVQLYVRDSESRVVKAEKELKAFKRVTLLPGQKKTVSLPLPYNAFAYYDVDDGEWTIDPGLYEIMIGTSAEDIKLRKTIELKQVHLNQ